MTEPKNWDGGARATGTGLGESDAGSSASTPGGGAGQGGSAGTLAGGIDDAVPSTAGDSALGSDLDNETAPPGSEDDPEPGGGEDSSDLSGRGLGSGQG